MGGGGEEHEAKITTGLTGEASDRLQSPSQTQPQELSSGFAASSPCRSPNPKKINSNPPPEDVERLRRVVRNTIAHSSPHDTGGGRGCGGGGGISRGVDPLHAPQWSQNHEACMSDMRRRLQEAGSPLVRAKDPAVLIGALLRRQVCSKRYKTKNLHRHLYSLVFCSRLCVYAPHS